MIPSTVIIFFLYNINTYSYFVKLIIGGGNLAGQ